MIGLVVPTRTDAYARRLLRSLAACEPSVAAVDRVALVDNGLSGICRSEFRDEWNGLLTVMNYPGSVVYDPFVFARAVNLGVAALDPRADVLIMNDDAVFCSPRPIAALEALLEEEIGSTRPGVRAADGQNAAGYRDEGEAPPPHLRVRDVFGIIGPRIEGGVGNPEQRVPLGPEQMLETAHTICFVAALIPRAAWDALGGLDERFIGYGFDDDDANRRVRNAGYKLGVTGAATVRHIGNEATGEMHGSYSALGREEHTRLYLLNQRLYAEKWGESGRGDIRG